jgi:putative restriction endonuclease
MELLNRLDAITIYKRGNSRAPHKPLYLLLLLARLRKGEPRLHSFEAISPNLSSAIRRFGTCTRTVHAEYPFWRLQNDDLAEVIPGSPSAYRLRKGNSDPTRVSLIQSKAEGGLLERDFVLLKKDPALQSFVCHRILDTHFPASLHEDILRFFEIDLAVNPSTDLEAESKAFRDATLLNYGYRCAISGFSSDAAVGYVGLESADIIWRNHGGENRGSNGIAMTTLHRKLFHLGLFTLTDNYEISLSSYLSVGGSVGLVQGRTIELPSQPEFLPSLPSLKWHRRWVFRR